MPVIIDGTNGINTPNTFAFKNRIINGGFTINQRGYVTNTSLTSGSYGHDRWKGGASNGTYTFTQASAGVNTTITITAGSIIQVIEGANLPEGGTYVLSWTGTAQGKIGAGSFGASGITGTITAGTNTNIEFNTGTCGNVQLEVGSTATSFDYRPYGTELALCQRYGKLLSSSASGIFTSTTVVDISCQIPPMRTAPTATIQGTLKFRNLTLGGTATANSPVIASSLSQYDGGFIEVTVSSFSIVPAINAVGLLTSDANNGIFLSSEL
jgi:hypothetical protein